MGLVLLVDSREGGGIHHHLLSICRGLHDLGVNVEVRTLPRGMGDYVWVRRSADGQETAVPCCIERKEVMDLAGSIQDGRWMAQQRAMVELWRRRVGWEHTRLVYLIEGRWPPVPHPCSCTTRCITPGVGGCGGPSVATVETALSSLGSKFEVAMTTGLSSSIARLAGIHRMLQDLPCMDHPESTISHTYEEIELLANCPGGSLPPWGEQTATEDPPRPSQQRPETPPSLLTIPLNGTVRSSCSTVSREQRTVMDYFPQKKKRIRPFEDTAGSSGVEASSGGGGTKKTRRAAPQASLEQQRGLYHRLGMSKWAAPPRCHLDLEYKPRPRSGNWSLLILLDRLGSPSLTKEQIHQELQRDFDESPPGQALCSQNPSDSVRNRPGMPLGSQGYNLVSHLSRLQMVDGRKELVILKRTGRHGMQDPTFELSAVGQSLAQVLHRDAEQEGYCRCGRLPSLPNGASLLPPDYEHLTQEQCKEACMVRGIAKTGSVDVLRGHLRDHDKELRRIVESSNAPEASAEAPTEGPLALITDSASSGGGSTVERDFAGEAGPGLSLHVKRSLLREMSGPAASPNQTPRSVAELVAREGFGFAPPMPEPETGGPGTAARPIELD